MNPVKTSIFALAVAAIIPAVEAYNSGDYSKAAAICSDILSKDPSDDAACYYLGMSSAATGNIAEGEKWLSAACEARPDNFWYRYHLASLYRCTQREEVAQIMLEKLLADFPSRTDLYYELIELYVSSGDLDKALSTLDQIELNSGRNESTALARFRILSAQQKMEEAYKALEAYNADYSSPRVLSLLGDYKSQAYEDSTALILYNEALEIEPDYPPALLGKAEMLRMNRRFDEYFSLLGQFLSSRDIPVESKGDYLGALSSQGDPKFLKLFSGDIDSLMAGFLRMYPADSTALTTAGLYYFKTARYDSGLACFRELSDSITDRPGPAIAYLQALYATERWDELAECSDRYHLSFPDDPFFLQTGMMSRFYLEEWDRVIGICEEMAGCFPSDTAMVADAWSTIADVYVRKGDSSQAFRAYEKALKADPTRSVTLNNYAYNLALSGKKLKKAYQMSRKTITAEPDNPTYLDTFGWILHLMGRDTEAKPFFKHALLYGGKDSAELLDHYAEVLYSLGEYSLAFTYWDQAKAKDDDGSLPGIDEKIAQRKKALGRK